MASLSKVESCAHLSTSSWALLTLSRTTSARSVVPANSGWLLAEEELAAAAETCERDDDAADAEPCPRLGLAWTIWEKEKNG